MTVSRETKSQFFKRWLWLVFGWHQWNYYNPYNRTCATCGRHEVSHYRIRWDKAWWEIFDDGEQWRHYGAANPLASVPVKQLAPDEAPQ